MRVYYNEIDEDNCLWLQALMNAGLIPKGVIDGRSITEVRASDLAGFDQCHFFAGISGWPLALQLAGWGARECWTGSCPCQPFSVAGKGLGTADERHLWPVFRDLIKEGRPQVIFGEQVASAEVVGTKLEATFVDAVQSGEFARANKIAKRLVASKSFHFDRRWIDGVFADLEAAGYSGWFDVLGAHSVGAPHIRQRLYWVADAESERGCGRESSRTGRLKESGRHGADDGLADLHSNGRNQTRGSVAATGSDGAVGDGSAVRLEHSTSDGRQSRGTESSGGGVVGGCSPIGLGDSNNARPQGRNGVRERASERSPWLSSVVIRCRDGKARRIPAQPALFPLAHGLPGRVAQLHGLGKAIVPQVAATFIKAFMKTRRITLNELIV